MIEASLATTPSGHTARARMMLLRATLAQNVGTGCAFGGFGISMLALQDRFDASRGMTAMALALVVLLMGGLGPVVAGLIMRWGLRPVMCAGVILSASGYAALAMAPNMTVALVACGLLIGPGTALFAALPPAILVSGWYPRARGWAMGITYIPLFVTFLPLLGLTIIQRYGLTTFLLVLAALHLMLLPLMLGVADAPVAAIAEDGSVDDGPRPPIATIMSGALLWWIVLGNGILNGTATAGPAHILAIVTEYGFVENIGALLLSISGAASILGSLLAGYASDRVGPARTLAGSGLAFAGGWALIATTGWLPAMAFAMLLIGIAGAAVFPPLTALVAQVYGTRDLPRVLGLVGVLSIPFTFVVSPIAGWLRDTSGTYITALLLLIAACSTVALIFFQVSRNLAGSRLALPADY